MVDSIARSQGNVVVAATLNRALKPAGFERIGRNEPIVIKGFSTDTATQLFQPITNVIDAQNLRFWNNGYSIACKRNRNGSTPGPLRPGSEHGNATKTQR